MPTLSQLAINRARLVIPLDDGGEDLVIIYQPGAITPRTRAAVQALQERPFDTLNETERDELLSAMTALLANTVLSWNLTDNGGAPIAPTVAGLADTDYSTQSWILGKITEAQRLGELNGQASTGASSSPASKALSPRKPASPRSRPNGAAARPSRTGLV